MNDRWHLVAVAGCVSRVVFGWIVLLFTLVLTSAPAAAQRLVVSGAELGDCVVRGDEDAAASFVLTNILADDYANKARPFTKKMQKCLSQKGVPVSIPMSPRSFDFMIASALVKDLYSDRNPGDLALADAGLVRDGVSMYRLPMARSGSEMIKLLRNYRANLNDEEGRFSAECVVRRDANKARQLLISVPSSAGETSAYKAIAADITAYSYKRIESAEELNEALGWLAIAYLKLARAAQTPVGN